jgi:hypothetical protein
MFKTRQDVESALREWFFEGYLRQVHEAYETYLNKSREEVFSYGYGEVLKAVDPIAFDLEAREHCWQLDFHEFCEFVGLDTEVINQIINVLIRKTNKWYSFKIVPAFDDGGYKIWRYCSLGYSFALLTSSDVRNELSGKKERVKRQIARLDYLIGLKANYPIVGMLRRERRQLIESL